MKRPALLLLALVPACASLSLKTERRLADPDADFHVQKLAVLPLPLTFRGCPEEIDTRARKNDLVALINKTALDQLKTRGYQLVTTSLDASDSDPKSAHNKDLGQALCSGTDLKSLPPSVEKFAEEIASKAGADQVFLGGVSRLRWHLKLALSDDNNGSGGDDVSKFEVRAEGAIFDVAHKRVVWSEYVDTQLFTGSYQDAIQRVLLFSELKHQDPHEKLFYDMPPPAGSAVPK